MGNWRSIHEFPHQTRCPRVREKATVNDDVIVQYSRPNALIKCMKIYIALLGMLVQKVSASSEDSTQRHGSGGHQMNLGVPSQDVWQCTSW